MPDEIESAKSQRTSAKSKFTRKLKEFLRAVAEDKGLEIVDRTYVELKESWKNVESKHDMYVALIEDKDCEHEETWIEELQRSFGDAMEKEVSYVQSKAAAGKKAMDEERLQETTKKDQEKMEKMVQQMTIKRKTSEIVFQQLVEDVKPVLEMDCITAALKKAQEGLDAAVADCKEANDKYLELLDKDKADAEFNWMKNIQKEYNAITSRIAVGIAKEQEKLKKLESTSKSKESCNLRLEKLKMPTFDGDIRQYPRFKKDFEQQVLPGLPKESAPYALRSCLGREPLSIVRSVEDDIEEMLKRLDEKYGDPAKIADVVIESIKEVKVIKEGEHKRFINFVNIVEDAYQDLRRLGLEKEITTTSSVSIIEKKLPNDVRKEWAKLVSFDTSEVDKRDKFPSLLKFLLNCKRAIEYDSSNLRSNTSYAGTVNLTASEKLEEDGHEDESNTEQQKETIISQNKCLFHPNSDHWTDTCNLYLSKSPEERINLLKDKSACWSCLRVGHRLAECKRKKACGENGCKGTHHKTIHMERKSGFAAACGDMTNSTCLLQIQRIKTSKGSTNVLWDSAASICLITYSKAKEEKLHGKQVQLSITKVGGIDEKLTSHLYRVPLVNQYGKTVFIEAYGIGKITADIQAVNLDGIVHLFKGVSAEEVTRPTRPVDLLIGYEYAGFHPQLERRDGHLLLLKNQFGKCIGGKHPSIKESHPTSELASARVNHVNAINVEDFYNIEGLGVACSPRCGGCKCGKCPIGSNDYTLKEERELKLIESKLTFDDEEKKWTAEYPWIRNPRELPDNRRAAMGMLISTEKRLAKNPEHAKVYQTQVENMIHSSVARK